MGQALALYLFARWTERDPRSGQLPDLVRAQWRLLREAVARDEREFATFWPLTNLPPLRTDLYMDVRLADWHHRRQPTHGLVRFANTSQDGFSCPLLPPGREEWLFVVGENLVRLSLAADLRAHPQLFHRRLGLQMFGMPGDGVVTAALQEPARREAAVKEAWRAAKWLTIVTPPFVRDMCAMPNNTHALEFVTTCEDIFSERVAKGMRNEYPSRPGRPHAPGEVVVWINGIFAPEWTLRLFAHVEKHSWTAWILCANNDRRIWPAARELTRHVQEYPVGTAMFHTNTDGYTSAPFRSNFPVLHLFVDNRPVGLHDPVEMPKIPAWA